MSTTTAAAHGTNRPTSMVRSMLPMLLLDIAIPLLVFQQAKQHGASDTAAYLLAGVGPLLGIALHLARTRRVDIVSGLFLAMYAISAVIAAIPAADSRLLLLKDSAMTGAFGILCLLSLLPFVARPLMFHFGLRFSTDGSAEARAQWNDRWQTLPGFRKAIRLMTLVWGLGYVLEAGLKVLAAEVLPFGAAYTVNQILPTAVTFGLIAWTIGVARRAKARGQAAAAAAH